MKQSGLLVGGISCLGFYLALVKDVPADVAVVLTAPLYQWAVLVFSYRFFISRYNREPKTFGPVILSTLGVLEAAIRCSSLERPDRGYIVATGLAMFSLPFVALGLLGRYVHAVAT